MRNASALVQRLTDIVSSAAGAAARGVEEVLGALVPQPEARLVPVRVRSNGPVRRP
ncbi:MULTISPECIES: hypothetical protein [unclassified Methylobacterium]|uniref:hypothetical protein n=1 Tax=unclassified Methylobacterium TaxID=2615210 RepID=UPI00164EEA77|nr:MULTISPECIES: hypothetical protein [unclassified Methylobacterium]